MAYVKSIADMAPGESAIIAGLLNDELSNKLLEMGFLPGAAVKMNYVAPFGDPVCVGLAGCDLTLRLQEAAMVAVLN